MIKLKLKLVPLIFILVAAALLVVGCTIQESPTGPTKVQPMPEPTAVEPVSEAAAEVIPEPVEESIILDSEEAVVEQLNKILS
ncbi:MAG TPA: hypothetical protein VJC39_03660 [Candidatus Nanoarchaeia archaeon]|nr:hypothetical protein [Candidatus Nanoarchaeia archaeon]